MGTAHLSSIIFPQHSCLLPGSMPFCDPVQALDFILEKSWVLPFWPELPRKDIRESLLEKGRRLLRERETWSGLQEYEASALFALPEYMKERGYGSFDVYKGQILGPVSLLALAKQEFQLSLSSQELVALLEKQISFQLKALSEIARKSIIFSDEAFFFELKSLNESEVKIVLEAYSYMAARLSDAGSYLGLHCCGFFDDFIFQIPCDLLLIDCVSHRFRDLFSLDRSLLWRSLLQRGTIVVPGIVQPNQKLSFEEHFATAEVRLDRYQDCIAEALAEEEDRCVLWSSCRGHGLDEEDFVRDLYQAPLMVNQSAFFGKKLCNW